MKKENDELTNLFRTRLENVHMPVREDFWNKLEKDIPLALNHRRVIFRRFAAAASVLLILGGASAAFWYFSPKQEIADAFTQVNVSNGAKGKMGADVVTEEFPPIHTAATHNYPVKKHSAGLAETGDEEETMSVSFSMSFSFSSSATPDRKNYSQRTQTSYVDDTNRAKSASGEEKKNNTTIDIATPEKERTWSAQLFASVSPFTTSKSSESETIKYQMPVSVGLTLRKELSKRFSLESGLVYTQLNSEEKKKEADVYSIIDQTLHYIGIPIKANIELFQSKRVNLYASGGGMVEKCLGGKEDPLQFSLSAGVGVECKLNDRLSLYAEPGLAYYFDNGSSLSTIRKEKPLNMNLLCGIRMTY